MSRMFLHQKIDNLFEVGLVGRRLFLFLFILTYSFAKALLINILNDHKINVAASNVFQP